MSPKAALCVVALVVLSLSQSVHQTHAVSCSNPSACNAVSNHPRYVDCVSGECKCLTNNGLTGNATAAFKCQCVSPNRVYWNDNGDPYCIQFEDAVAYAKEQKRNAILTAQITRLYNSLVYPIPAIIMGALIQGLSLTDPNNPITGLFVPTASGRVDPLGEFFNLDSIVEYFYGAVYTNTSYITEVQFKKLTVDGNKVTSRVDLTINLVQDAGPPATIFTHKLTQTGIFTFNDDNLIQKTELIIHNLGWSNVDTFQFDIGTLCFLILNQAGCNAQNDPLGYYENIGTCVGNLTATPRGSWDIVRDDSIICRTWHTLLAFARPQVHCPHVGRTGGTKCVYHPYNEYYNQDF